MNLATTQAEPATPDMAYFPLRASLQALLNGPPTPRAAPVQPLWLTVPAETFGVTLDFSAAMLQHSLRPKNDAPDAPDLHFDATSVLGLVHRWNLELAGLLNSRQLDQPAAEEAAAQLAEQSLLLLAAIRARHVADAQSARHG